MSDRAEDRTAPTVSGATKLAIIRRLGEDWQALADVLEIPIDHQRRFENTNDPARRLWAWLEDRNQLGRLPAALRQIERSDLASLLRAGSDTLSNATVDFAGLIRERTDEFIGRRELIRRIGEVLDDPSFTSGYVVIHGEPGIGKTALLAWLVEQWDLVHHFNSVLIGLTSTERFLSNVCAQLILAHGLPYDRLPEGAGADSSTLLRLLAESAQQRRVVVAVDAVDEAGDGSTGTNRLLLPPALPADTFMLLTMRDPDSVALYIDERRDLVIDENDAENMSDAREYVDTFIERHAAEMGQRLAALGLSATEFADLVTERSEGNFMYLRHVLRGIRDGAPRGTGRVVLDQLPRGLQAYYAQLERQLGVVGGTAPERQLRILAVLAAWPEPLTVARLARFAGERLDTTRAVLRGWAHVLNRIESPDGPRYALYHASFRDFLAKRLDLADVRSQIASAVEDMLP